MAHALNPRICAKCKRVMSKYADMWHSHERGFERLKICTYCYHKEYHTPLIINNDIKSIFYSSYKRGTCFSKDEKRFLTLRLIAKGLNDDEAYQRVNQINEVVKNAHKLNRSHYNKLNRMPLPFQHEFRKLIEKRY